MRAVRSDSNQIGIRGLDQRMQLLILNIGEGVRQRANGTAREIWQIAVVFKARESVRRKRSFGQLTLANSSRCEQRYLQ